MKKLIYFFVFLVMVSLVVAFPFKYRDVVMDIRNSEFTRDFYTSNNQTLASWIFGNLTVIGSISGPYTSGYTFSNLTDDVANSTNVTLTNINGRLVATFNMSCAQITGSSALCDGDDASGAGGSETTNNSDINASTLYAKFIQKRLADELVIVGNVNITGTINFSLSSLSDFSRIQLETNSFKLANYTTLENSACIIVNLTNYIQDNASMLRVGNISNILLNSFKNSNFTTQYDLRADRYSITNYSTEYASTGFKLGNLTAPTTSVTFNNVTTSQTNNSMGNFSIFQYNSTCAGIRFSTGGIILSCT